MRAPSRFLPSDGLCGERVQVASRSTCVGGGRCVGGWRTKKYGAKLNFIDLWRCGCDIYRWDFAMLYKSVFCMTSRIQSIFISIGVLHRIPSIELKKNTLITIFFCIYTLFVGRTCKRRLPLYRYFIDSFSVKP